MLRKSLRSVIRALRRASRLRRVRSAPALSITRTPQAAETELDPQIAQNPCSSPAIRLRGNTKVDILASSSVIEQTDVDHPNTTSVAFGDASEPSAPAKENEQSDPTEHGADFEDSSEDEAEPPPINPYAVVSTAPSSRIICPDSGRPARRLALYSVDQVLGEVMARRCPGWVPTTERSYAENSGHPSHSRWMATVPEWEFDNCAVHIPVTMNSGNPFGGPVCWEGDGRGQGAQEEGAFEVGSADAEEGEVVNDLEVETRLDVIPRAFLEI